MRPHPEAEPAPGDPTAHPGWLKVIPRALRVHQWAKNTLIFAPLVASHQIFDDRLLAMPLLAFFAFSLCASASYLLNDLLDLESDRLDPAKRHRPLAAGHLSPTAAIVLAVIVFGIGIAFAWMLPRGFLWVLLIYLVTTLAYSLHLKRVLMLDVVVLATLYALRILAGNMAFAIEISEWLLALSVFLFLSLAMIKRYTELLGRQRAGSPPSDRRGYVAEDLDLIGTLGSASGYIAVLVMSLYITSNRVRIRYDHPDLLWLVCLVMLYWIGRAWLIARRGDMDADPVLFALKDKVSYGSALVILLIVALASGALI